MPVMNIDTATQRVLAVGMPLVAVALSLLIVYPGWGRYHELKAEVAAERVRLRDLREAPVPAPAAAQAAAVDVESEPSHFIGEITALARASGCEITGLDVEPQKQKPDDEALVRPIRSRVTLSGSFPQVRSFLLQLSRASRLYTVVDLTVQRPSGGRDDGRAAAVSATVTIERYVTEPFDEREPSRTAQAVEGR
jgi:hypothetical protein